MTIASAVVKPAARLSSEQLSSLAALLADADGSTNPLPYIRGVMPDLALVRCDADDMRGIVPFQRSGSYDMFLVDTANHCWRIIDDLAEASGVVIAAHS